MDEEIERLVVRVRADTSGFLRDVGVMRGEIDGPLGESAERTGRRIEEALVRAARSGKLGFEDLRAMALQVLGEIAAAAVRSGIDSLFGGGGGVLKPVGGPPIAIPGRATGGPVSPARPYWVGERGPELFVPASAGQVAVPMAAGARDVRVAITVNTSGEAAPRALAQSSRQVARAVRAALEGAA